MSIPGVSFPLKVRFMRFRIGVSAIIRGFFSTYRGYLGVYYLITVFVHRIKVILSFQNPDAFK